MCSVYTPLWTNEIQLRDTVKKKKKNIIIRIIKIKISSMSRLITNVDLLIYFKCFSPCRLTYSNTYIMINGLENSKTPDFSHAS